MLKIQLCLVLLLAVSSTLAQNAPAPSKSLVGQKLKPWKIERRLWTNTPSSVWLGGTKGHVTVIEFFRISCSHCQDAAPSRRALFEKFSSRGVKMIGFQSPGGTFPDSGNPENNWSQVKATVKEWKLPYPVAFDRDRQLFNSYRLAFYPTVVVLDESGVVRFEQTGFTAEKDASLKRAIEALLQESQDR